MTFLSPLTLLGLALVALPVAIHLLVRKRARRIDFPSLRFMRETPSFKLHPRRIRQPLLLALRAAAIVLLVLGLARPLFTLSKGNPSAIRFILMDSSLSMNARGRTYAAREQARTIISKLSAGERAAVIEFAADAKVLAEPTTDQGNLLEAVEKYQPTNSATNYDSGVVAVNLMLRQEPQPTGEIDLISDFQHAQSQNGNALPALPIVTYPVGSQLDRNGFMTEESLRQTEQGINLSATEMFSEIDGRKGARHSWNIDSAEGTARGIEWRTESNGQVTGRISILEPDDFDQDDQRYFAFAPPREARARLIEDGRDGPYVRVALESASDKLVIDREPALPNSAAELRRYALVVLTVHGAPDGGTIRLLSDYARGGGSVLMFLSRDLDTESWNALARAEKESEMPFESLARIEGKLNLNPTDNDAPELRELDNSSLASISSVRVKAGYAINPRDSVDTMMRWNDGSPAVVSSRIGEGKVLLFATSTSRESSELGTSASFPVLMSSIVRSATQSRLPLSYGIGQAVQLGVASDTEVKITNTRGGLAEVRAGQLVGRPLDYFDEPGIYRLDFVGRQMFVALNPPASESERTVLTDDQMKSRFSAKKDVSAPAVSEWRETAERSGTTWRYFLIAVFLLIIAELFASSGGLLRLPPSRSERLGE